MPPHARVPIADARILITGTARDCAAFLGPGIASLERATAGFRQRQFLIIESDSTDGTPAVLARLAREGRIAYESLGALTGRMPFRTQRIAHCRNRILDHVHTESARYDYVIVADLDGVNATIERSALESGWNTAEPWDGLTANQNGAYYDVWALRHPAWSPNDCWEAVRQLTPLFGARKACQMAVYGRQVRLPSTGGLVEVESAFGGLAIYRTEAFVAGHYDGLTADGREICEHVPFHAAMRAAGFRIFINPQMLNTSPS
ncbi:MAG: hypothetical protein JSR28_03595, partial [Proteobacteria bacterium]|nr:hypothetical protein [Pseudomonadota bacterium]